MLEKHPFDHVGSRERDFVTVLFSSDASFGAVLIIKTMLFLLWGGRVDRLITARFRQKTRASLKSLLHSPKQVSVITLILPGLIFDIQSSAGACAIVSGFKWRCRCPCG